MLRKCASHLLLRFGRTQLLLLDGRPWYRIPILTLPHKYTKVRPFGTLRMTYAVRYTTEKARRL